MTLSEKILRHLYDEDTTVYRGRIFTRFKYYQRGSIIQVLRSLRDSGLIDEEPRGWFTINEHGVARCQ